MMSVKLENIFVDLVGHVSYKFKLLCAKPRSEIYHKHKDYKSKVKKVLGL